MKIHMLLMLSVFALGGCAMLGSVQGAAGNSLMDAQETSVSPLPTPSAAQPADDMSPRLIIPVTGGPPVIGIPPGGGLFVPVTGGPAVMGIPTSP